MRSRRMAIYLPGLDGGGAERLQIDLAGYFQQQGVDVTLLLDRADGPLMSIVPPGIQIVSLGSRQILKVLPRLIGYLRRSKPDFLLSHLGQNNIVALWAKRLAQIRFTLVVTLHNTLSAEAQRGMKYRLLPLLYRISIQKADAVVMVSEGVRDDFAAVVSCQNRHPAVIYNGVVTPDFDLRASMPLEHPWFREELPVFVAAGRLVEQKGFDTLLRAFAELPLRHEARLIILGEGPLRPLLEKLAQELGVSERVRLPGFQSNPLPFMVRATAVVLSSIYEGLGNVLAEALACGTPVISTNCPHGPAEVLGHGQYGTLVPVGDVKALARAMQDTLERPRFSREFLQARGREFTVSRCGEKYLALLEELECRSAA